MATAINATLSIISSSFAGKTTSARAAESIQRQVAIAKKPAQTTLTKKQDEKASSAGPLASSLALSGAAIATSLAAPMAALADVLDLPMTISDPVVLVAGSAAVIIPIGLFALLRGKGYAGDLVPAKALEKLEEEEGAVLLDIRRKEEKKEGSPSLKGIRRKIVTTVFEIEEADGVAVPDPEFAAKVSAIKGVDISKALVVLDSSGSTAGDAAKVLSKNGFAKVYAVKGGAASWKESGLPWASPLPSFRLDIGTLKEAFSSSVEENKNLLPASLGVAAAAGASLVLASEVEVALQLLGSAAVVQLLVKKFLFAEDRKRTIAEIREFLDTKVAPAQMVDDLKEIGSAILPELKEKLEQATAETGAVATEAAADINGAAAASTPTPAPKSSTDFPPSPTPLSPYTMYPELKPPSSPTPKPPTVSAAAAAPPAPPKEEAPPAPAPPKPSSTDFPPPPRPLSPYAMYPDLKPPTSPTPKPPTAPVVAATEPASEAEPEPTPQSASPAVAALSAKPSSTNFPPPPRPLSPYAMYPDLKPPTSPTPSAP